MCVWGGGSRGGGRASFFVPAVAGPRSKRFWRAPAVHTPRHPRPTSPPTHHWPCDRKKAIGHARSRCLLVTTSNHLLHPHHHPATRLQPTLGLCVWFLKQELRGLWSKYPFLLHIIFLYSGALFNNTLASDDTITARAHSALQSREKTFLSLSILEH